MNFTLGETEKKKKSHHSFCSYTFTLNLYRLDKFKGILC